MLKCYYNNIMIVLIFVILAKLFFLTNNILNLSNTFLRYLFNNNSVEIDNINMYLHFNLYSLHFDDSRLSFFPTKFILMRFLNKNSYIFFINVLLEYFCFCTFIYCVNILCFEVIKDQT